MAASSDGRAIADRGRFTGTKGGCDAIKLKAYLDYNLYDHTCGRHP